MVPIQIELRENLPQGITGLHRVSHRECERLPFSTVPQAGWAGIKNGKLLRLAQSRFDAFITVDQNMTFQQNFEGISITVFVLQARSNALEDLLPFVPKLLNLLNDPLPGTPVLLGR